VTGQRPIGDHWLTLITPELMTEEKLEKSESYIFGDCALDADRRELRVAGESVTTQPKAFELLLYLVRNRHRAVNKDELQDQIWPHSIVTETALTRCVMKARRAVNDDADRQSVIKTVHGHGYRFIADVQADTPSAVPADAPATEKPSPGRRRIPAMVAALVVALAAAWWFVATPVHSETVRLAVLPVENATGETDLDWAETGFMALINRMLEDRSIAVVSGSSVSNLAGSQSPADLMATNSEFREALQKTTGFTHMLGATLERDGDLYRLTFTLSNGNDRPEVRTIVGQEPVQLITQLVNTAAVMVTSGTPAPLRRSSVSDDDFINEAYARAMNLEMEGRYEEAQRMFQVIIEQDPQLFWPRYEYALCARQLRDFEAAERMFIELRAETEEQGELERLAAVNNSLGIMYMGRRRNEEALTAFETAVRLAEEIGDLRYAATAHQNIGLLAKNQGDMALAYEHMTLSATLFEQMDIQSLPGQLLNNMSGVLIQLGRLEEAEQKSLAAIETFRLTGQRLYESYALSRLAGIYRRNGMLLEAEDAAQSGLAVRVELGDRRGTASSNLTLSDIALDRGDLTRALQYAQQALDIGAEIDDQDVTIGALNTSATASLALHRPHDALASYTAEEAIARNVDSRQSVFGARYGIARSWIQIGDYDTAAAIADELLADARENGRRREETAGLNLHAEIFIAKEQWQSAIEQLAEVLSISEEIGDNGLAASAHAKLARALLETGQIDQAESHINLILAQRPADADVLKLQAQLAALRDQPAAAVEFMTAARSSAGEAWQDSDDQVLKSYHETVAAMALR
jgi:DNA-binding winged helix-turn-helix (wHTH) protein/tetratricopeptide (TPR) repeat protein